MVRPFARVFRPPARGLLTPRRIGSRAEADRERVEEALSISAFLWILIVGLAIVIAIAYLL